jgi:hypothetical protein
MAIFEAHLTVSEVRGEIEISVEAHERGTVTLLAELVAVGSETVLAGYAEMPETQAFELGIALIRASSIARQARLRHATRTEPPWD